MKENTVVFIQNKTLLYIENNTYKTNFMLASKKKIMHT